MERIRYLGCFIIHVLNIDGKNGTDKNVRFHWDSGIERIRFKGFLLYKHTVPDKLAYVMNVNISQIRSFIELLET